MKIRVNKNVISKLKPCQPRFDNYLKHYDSFDADILKFLDLEHITHHDKLWVALRLLPIELMEVFAIDCAFAANAAYAAANAADYAADYAAYAANVAAADAARYAANADDYAAANVADAAANAAYAATHVAARSSAEKEQQNQINVLKYLIKGA